MSLNQRYWIRDFRPRSKSIHVLIYREEFITLSCLELRLNLPLRLFRWIFQRINCKRLRRRCHIPHLICSMETYISSMHSCMRGIITSWAFVFVITSIYGGIFLNWRVSFIMCFLTLSPQVFHSVFQLSHSLGTSFSKGVKDFFVFLNGKPHRRFVWITTTTKMTRGIKRRRAYQFGVG